MKTKNALIAPQPSPSQKSGGGCLERLVRRGRRGDRVLLYCSGFPSRHGGTITALRNTGAGVREAVILPDGADRVVYLFQDAICGYELPPNNKLSGGEKSTDQRS